MDTSFNEMYKWTNDVDTLRLWGSFVLSQQIDYDSDSL